MKIFRKLSFTVYCFAHLFDVLFVQHMFMRHYHLSSSGYTADITKIVLVFLAGLFTSVKINMYLLFHYRYQM